MCSHLTNLRRGYIVSVTEVVGLMSYGFLLCLGLSNAAQAGNAASAEDEMKSAQPESILSDANESH